MKKILALISTIIIVSSLSACAFNTIFNKNESSSRTETEKYTELADGTYLYEQYSVSTDNNIQFSDEKGDILIDSSDLLYISAKRSEDNGFYIELQFNEEGTVKFADVTKNNIGKKINIVLDGQILLSPMVYYEITDGIVIIFNYESYEEMILFFNQLIK